MPLLEDNNQGNLGHQVFDLITREIIDLRQVRHISVNRPLIADYGKPLIRSRVYYTAVLDYEFINVKVQVRAGDLHNLVDWSFIDENELRTFTNFNRVIEDPESPRTYYREADYFREIRAERDIVVGVLEPLEDDDNDNVDNMEDKVELKRKPIEFNGQKKPLNVNQYFNIYGEIPVERKRTKEYSELEAIVKKRSIDLGLESKTFLAFEGLKNTFGVEIETTTGCVYTQEFKRDRYAMEGYNFSGVFDGSLRDKDGSGPWGQEYVTGVLKGDAGLQQLNKINNVIKKHCEVDKRCAFHVHIGSLKWNSEDIVFMYILGIMLEDEIMSIMPHSRRDNEYCKRLIPLKRNNVSRLRSAKTKSGYKQAIKNCYNDIFNIVGKNGNPNKFINKNTLHPRGHNGGYNRSTDHRYSWLNFTNVVFNQRGDLNNKTIEYRNHSGTLDFTKMYYWIKICMAITSFVSVGRKDILEAVREGKRITLSDILSKVYPKTGSRLINYIKLRKNIFLDMSNENEDYKTSNTEINNIKELLCV